MQGQAGLPQRLVDVAIHSIQSARRLLENPALGDQDPGHVVADNKARGLDLGIDEELAQRGCLSSVVEGYGNNLVGDVTPRSALPTGQLTTAC